MKNDDAGDAAMYFEQHGEPYTDVVSTAVPATRWRKPCSPSLSRTYPRRSHTLGLPCICALRRHRGECASVAGSGTSSSASIARIMPPLPPPLPPHPCQHRCGFAVQPPPTGTVHNALCTTHSTAHSDGTLTATSDQLLLRCGARRTLIRIPSTWPVHGCCEITSARLMR